MNSRAVRNIGRFRTNAVHAHFCFIYPCCFFPSYTNKHANTKMVLFYKEDGEKTIATTKTNDKILQVCPKLKIQSSDFILDTRYQISTMSLQHSLSSHQSEPYFFLKDPMMNKVERNANLRVAWNSLEMTQWIQINLKIAVH